MYMPLMVEIKKAVVFGGERGEGLQKVQKLAVFAQELICVPEGPDFPSEINLPEGPLDLVESTLILSAPRTVPVVQEPASLSNFLIYLDGATFVTSDLQDRHLNQAISIACRERGILCNIIDTKDLSNTWFMSLITHSHIQVGISSQGGCAFYSVQTRKELEKEMGRRNHVSRILTDLRQEIHPASARYQVLERIYHDGKFKKFIKKEKWKKALKRGRTFL